MHLDGAAASTSEGPSPEDQPRRPSFLDSMGIDPDSPAMKALIQLSTKPKKSILKKSNSYTIHSFGLPGMGQGPQRPTIPMDDSSWRKRFTPSNGDSSYRNYKTVTGAEHPKWKNALDNLGALFKRPSNTNVHEKAMEAFALGAGAAMGQDVTDYMSPAPPHVDMTLGKKDF